MTEEELRKAKWLVADAAEALDRAMKDWPEGKSGHALAMLMSASLIVAFLQEKFDADS